MSREAVELVLNGVQPTRAAGGHLDLVAIEGELVRIRVNGLCAGCPGFQEQPSASTRPVEGVPGGLSLDEHLAAVEADLIAWALRASGGNKSRAADLLHIKRTTLADRISRHSARLLDIPGVGTSAYAAPRERQS